MSSETEWLPALQAATLLARKFGGLTIAKQGLALGLHEGLLRARAEWVIFVKEGDEEPTELVATFEEPIEIPAEAWSLSLNWDADRLSWDWDYGCFDVEGYAVEDDKSFGEVRFLREEILAIDPQSTPYNSLQQPRPVKAVMESVLTRRAVGPRKWDWLPAFSELVAHADHPDGLERILGEYKRGFQAKLEKWFAVWFDERFDDCPSEDQRRIHARLIIDALERSRSERQTR